MRKPWFNLLSTVLISAVFLSGCSGGESGSRAESENENEGTIKIGTNYEMTGGQSTFGNSSVKGIRLAVEEINAAGGVLGKQLELVEADNASKPEESTRAAQKLITSDKVVALLGPSTSTNTLGAVPIAMEKQIPMITSSATNSKITVDERTGKVNDWIFRTCFIDPFQGQVMASFAKDELNAATAVIYTDTTSDYSKGLQASFKETFTAAGGEIVAEESYAQKDSDFKAVLTRIKDKNPDVIYLPGYYEEVGKIVKQAREIGITVPFLGGDGWDSPELVKIAGEDPLNNTYISNHYSSEDTAPEVKSFVDAYKKANGDEAPDGFAALGYDTVKLLADALTRAGSTEPEKVRDALASTTDLQLATGTVTLNEFHDPVKSAAVLEYVDGKQTFVTKVNP
ncbi:ABC transporter substrate-binding protein [Paenibacillus shunpengii]|uniref:ABC transporter substrate-binding protein n=1 Tax=Paenibacillus shunpengii TaxID=2054424 RepID=A0ABW5SJV5_9BACL|nr:MULTISPECIES: ABC transporter substrate-binding protein [unclassified Paenibacillus]OMC71156.1 ethanolamine utilization protein EutJ [Paenibacillus sp. FSL H7-0326]SDW18266.1 amino acid/amide ABC transporter substrate-binding protein, HAAT family [Paenibacillus sp. PDC88]